MMAAANINRDALTFTGGAFLRFGPSKCWFTRNQPSEVSAVRPLSRECLARHTTVPTERGVFSTH